MSKRPLWATPLRVAMLDERFAQSLPETTVQFYDHLDVVVFDGMPMSKYVELLTKDIGHHLIEYWKEDDREERSYLWRLEKRLMHAMPQIKKRGRFDSISRAQYLDERPTFKIVAVGVGAFTQRMVAKVVIPDLGHKVIWVDLTGVHVGKQKLNKLAKRRGKVPNEIVNIVSREVRRRL